MKLFVVGWFVVADSFEPVRNPRKTNRFTKTDATLRTSETIPRKTARLGDFTRPKVARESLHSSIPNPTIQIFPFQQSDYCTNTNTIESQKRHKERTKKTTDKKDCKDHTHKDQNTSTKKHKHKDHRQKKTAKTTDKEQNTSTKKHRNTITKTARQRNRTNF